MSAFDKACAVVEKALGRKNNPVIAIDGNCAAGKSTLAEKLAIRYGCGVVHMDDFFLPKELRADERFAIPGGNVHYERFIEEVVQQLGKPAFSYRVFDCRTMDYSGERCIDATAPVIVEGAYSLLPQFGSYYDASIFLRINPQLQREVILQRNGAEMLPRFLNQWIPLEETYFQAYDIASKCDIVIER